MRNLTIKKLHHDACTVASLREFAHMLANNELYRYALAGEMRINADVLEQVARDWLTRK